MPTLDFPSNPTNGQTYTLNGVTYYYNSTIGAWLTQLTGMNIDSSSNTQVLFNDAGIANGSPGFTFNKANNTLFVTGNVVVGTGTTTITDGFINVSSLRSPSGAISVTSNLDLGSTTSHIRLPVGTTAQRPAGASGMIRMNSTTNYPEWFDAPTSSWVNLKDSVSYSIDYLIVAGGGGGASGYGGGGGAGGYISGSTTVTRASTYTATIGAGGAAQGSTNSNGNNGSNSTLASLTAAVGGGGGGWDDNAGRSGGSGGGGSDGAGGGSGTAGQGNNGGNSSNAWGGAGGGGAGAVGSATRDLGGTQAGGAGLNWQSLGTFYAGGGGGCARTDAGNASAIGGVGGNGGGGAGSSTNQGAGTAGTANRGGGGGGGGNSGFGQAGGSGVIIIRYLGSQAGSGGTVTSAGGYTYHTFTTSGTFTA